MIASVDELCTLGNIDMSTLTPADRKLIDAQVIRHVTTVKNKIKEAMNRGDDKKSYSILFRLFANEDELRRLGVKGETNITTNIDKKIEIISSDPGILEKLKSL